MVIVMNHERCLAPICCSYSNAGPVIGNGHFGKSSAGGPPVRGAAMAGQHFSAAEPRFSQELQMGSLKVHDGTGLKVQASDRQCIKAAGLWIQNGHGQMMPASQIFAECWSHVGAGSFIPFCHEVSTSFVTSRSTCRASSLRSLNLEWLLSVLLEIQGCLSVATLVLHIVASLGLLSGFTAVTEAAADGQGSASRCSNVQTRRESGLLAPARLTEKEC